MKFTEAQLEQAFIELLGQEDIPHVLGGDIVRSEEEVLIKEDLKAFLLNQYKADKLNRIRSRPDHSSIGSLFFFRLIREQQSHYETHFRWFRSKT